MEKEQLLKEFSDELRNPVIRSINDYLTSSLEVDQDIKSSLKKYFEKCEVGHDGLKTFNLERWSSFGGSESNPTIEIVEVGERFQLGMTHYGMLRPLRQKDYESRNKIILHLIHDFLEHPKKFFKKNSK